MGCGSGCMKCVLNTINVFWAIGSILILIVAGFTVGIAPKVFTYLLIVIGAVGLIASFVGCCGICQEHICMTSTYAVFILISLLLQIFGNVFAGKVESIRKYADEDVNKAWEKEIKEPGSMDFLQKAFNCCGKNGPNDYSFINHQIPDSCYVHTKTGETKLYSDGCTKKLEDTYVALVKSMVNGSWGTIIFTVIMLLFSVYLVMRFRSKQRHYNY